jgi:hypothetical protein
VPNPSASTPNGAIMIALCGKYRRRIASHSPLATTNAPVQNQNTATPVDISRPVTRLNGSINVSAGAAPKYK